LPSWGRDLTPACWPVAECLCIQDANCSEVKPTRRENRNRAPPAFKLRSRAPCRRREFGGTARCDIEKDQGKLRPDLIHNTLLGYCHATTSENHGSADSMKVIRSNELTRFPLRFSPASSSRIGGQTRSASRSPGRCGCGGDCNGIAIAPSAGALRPSCGTNRPPEIHRASDDETPQYVRFARANRAR
jgi:hypothetical protein